MLRFIVALVLLAVLTPDTTACETQQRRGGFFARVFAAQRAVVRLPARVATAPYRALARPAASYSYSSSYRRTTTYSAFPPVVVVPKAIPAPMPPPIK